MITAFGVASADGRPIRSIGPEDHGYLTYVRPPSGFQIFLEAQPGISRQPPGTIMFNSNPGNPGVLPQFQILLSRAIGNGSARVCDNGPDADNLGGVPAVVPTNFGGTQQSSNAINDFSCRFDARTASFACTRDPFTQMEGFTVAGSTIQYCTRSGVGTELAFGLGDTILTARVLDITNQPGPPASIVIWYWALKAGGCA
jgi:hypothetical protein